MGDPGAGRLQFVGEQGARSLDLFGREHGRVIRLLRTRTLWPFIWYRLIAGGLFVLLLTTVRS